MAIIKYKNSKGNMEELPIIINHNAKTAYDLAVECGFIGTIEEWLKSLAYDDTNLIKEFNSLNQNLELHKVNVTQDIEKFKEVKSLEISQGINSFEVNANQNLDLYKVSINQEIQDYKDSKSIEIKKDIDNYVSTKDLELNKNLESYKTDTNKNIELYKTNTTQYIDNYKINKDLEINTNLESYKTTTTEKIEKNLDNYKATKDLEINTSLENYKAINVETVEGNYITVNDSVGGYIDNIEILGNTYQNPSNLTDIQSVGTLREDGLYDMSLLSCGKNLLDKDSYKYISINTSTGIETPSTNRICFGFIPSKENTNINITVNNTYKIVSTYFYSGDKKFISATTSTNIVTPTNCKFIKVSFGKSGNEDVSISDVTNIQAQVELGTSSTPYEPYQVNKSSILLPCPLEKVGDVKDRLYYDKMKNAWCVEKNVDTEKLDGINCSFSKSSSDGTWFVGTTTHTKSKANSPLIVSKIKSGNLSTEECMYKGINGFAIRILESTIGGNTSTLLNSWLQNNNIVVKYQLTTPQIIELPLNTQIQLNSFLGTTNIFTEDTVIEPTIKATIPKSLGASIQSLNKKTDTISQRVEKVETLKKGNELEVSTDKGYVVVESTNEGYINDLKIEGNTLVNLLGSKIITDGYSGSSSKGKLDRVPPIFTLVNTTGTYDIQIMCFKDSVHKASADLRKANPIQKFELGEYDEIRLRLNGTDGLLPQYVIALEGDHTQNPPLYFEGLKSVGEGVDKIEILSSKEDGNLFDLNDLISDNKNNYNSFKVLNTKVAITKLTNNSSFVGVYIPTQQGISYTLQYKGSSDKSGSGTAIYIYDDKPWGVNLGSITSINNSVFSNLTFKAKSSKTYIGLYCGSTVTISETITFDEIIVTKGSAMLPSYTPYKGHKKQILYQTKENTYEKPILRSVESVSDTIEKHSDEKYYFHKRCAEVVLNGSENWNLSVTNNNTSMFTIVNLKNMKSDSTFICDKFIKSSGDVERMNITSSIWINILKTKLVTQDLAGFKTWLQSNNVTVVYQLETEEVYECVNLDLDSYQGETSLICNSGTISPKITFKIASHIANTINVLKDKINYLEDKSIKSNKEKVILENKVNEQLNCVKAEFNNQLDNIKTGISDVNLSIEGNYITVNDSVSGSISNIEILGNTIQDAVDLKNIKSVANLQDDGLYKMSILSTGKNLFNHKNYSMSSDNGVHSIQLEGNKYTFKNTTADGFLFPIKVKKNTTYRFSGNNCSGIVNIRVYKLDNSTAITSICGNATSFDTSFTFTEDETVYFRIWNIVTDVVIHDLQIEEGTVATTYEPYQENKSSILLPCQLEKVGAVKDKLFRRNDGVWCIEKNIENILLNGNETISISKTNTNTMLFSFPINSSIKGGVNSIVSICSNFKCSTASSQWSTDEESCAINNNGQIIIAILKSKLTTTQDVAGFKTWLSQNPTLVKYQLATTQIIELPLDTQIQLNSYLGTTNIFTEDTVIEPTIKATIPKSLGASINSLVNKTDNLSQRLENVETLKEGSELEVTTDKGYVVCENTSNGQIEGLKVEGKTLVNIADKVKYTDTIGGWKTSLDNLHFYKPNTVYTFIGNVTTLSDGVKLYIKGSILNKGYNITTFTLGDVIDSISIYSAGSPGNFVVDNAIILEGDYTQNPPNYFEGLKSVGDGVDGIEVLSQNGTCENSVLESGNIYGSTGVNYADVNNVRAKNFISVRPNTKYYIKTEFSGVIRFYKKDGTYINSPIAISKEILTPNECYNLKLVIATTDLSTKYTISKLKELPPHQSNKKQILYQTKENTYEKPILRSVESVSDSIEKHSDGKYYFHKRCGKAVLDGGINENWIVQGLGSVSTHLGVYLNEMIPNTKIYQLVVCDKLPSVNLGATGFAGDNIFISLTGKININILKTRLITQDVEGFKTWLQTNPITVVYQLATEEIYECVNLDLDSYQGETSVIVDSGAISPKLTFKIASHIGNTISVLKDRINYLEDKVIGMFKNVLAGNVQTLAYELYPEDFKKEEEIETVEGTDLL